MKKKLVCIILSIIMVSAILPMGLFSVGAAEQKIIDEDFYQFADSVMSMVNEEEQIGEQNVGEEPIDIVENDIFKTKRLIVKARGSIDDYGAISKAEGYFNLHIFQYATIEETKIAYNKYLSLKAVEYVEPDAEVTIDSADESNVVSNEVEQVYKSWGAEKMNIEAYKEHLRGTVGEENYPQIIVAVLDTGIDSDHEMFGGIYDEETNPDGRILSYGKDFSNNDNDPEDDNSHGTHVSGTIAELTEENVKILPIKVLNNDGKGSTVEVCLGMTLAVNLGAKLINMSLGGRGSSETYKDIINEAYKAGISFIVSAGNDGEDAGAFFPARIENCITVSWVNGKIKKASNSNYGEIIDVSAPGENISSAQMGGGYVEKRGTSMAAPHVTALAALLCTKDNKMSAQKLEIAIKSNTYDAGTEGFDTEHGYGFVYANPEKDISFANINFNQESGIYNGAIELEITSSDPNVSIYYTLDSKIPNLSSSEYKGAIDVNRTSRVRAVAYRNENGNTYVDSLLLDEVFYIEGTEPDYTLEVDSSGAITGAVGFFPDELIIPSEINGIAVKSIGNSAFKECFGLKNVVIGDNVTSIGSEAFYSCVNLESITIGNNVTSIGASSFYYCEKLENIIIPDSVISIGLQAFSGCEKLESVTIGNNVTTIGGLAFSGCENLESVTIGNNVTSIGRFAFEKTPWLDNQTDDFVIVGNSVLIKYNGNGENVTLPNEVRSIAGSAFYNCDNITSIDIGDNVKEIGEHAFHDCGGLTSIIIPDSTEKIGGYAFNKCTNLVNLTLGKGITSIGEYAFFNCTSLENICYNITGKLSFNSDNIFSKTIGSEKNGLSVIFGNNVTRIPDELFSGCSKLKSLTIPNSVITIGTSAFSECFALKSITFGEGSSLETIEDNAFYHCEKLTKITIPDGVTTIGISAFSGCSVLESVIFGEGSSLETIENNAFYYCKKLKKITTPDGVTTIGSSAFSGCSALESVTFGEGSSLETIENNAFYYCKKLKKITIPDGVTTIGSSAFQECSALESITFKEGSELTEIASRAFNSCYMLENITIPSSVTKIGEYAFAGDIALKDVTFGEGSQLTKIGSKAFNGCTMLENIIIPDKVTEIGEQAFYICKNLKDITIPDSVTKIGSYAFKECSVLKSVTFGEGSQLTKIGSEAFRACTNLGSITIPVSVTAIGADAFWGCTGLIIYGVPNSFAHTYANSNGFVFKSMTGHTVTFKDWNDEIIETQDVEENGSATAPEAPEREGYEFNGWDKDFSNVTEDMEVKATYVIKQYTITFNTNGGSEVATITQDYGTEIVAPANPTKEGSTFIRWDKDLPATMPAENITLTAIYYTEAYEMTFVFGKEDSPVVFDVWTVKHGRTVQDWMIPSERSIKEAGKDKLMVFTGRWLNEQGKVVDPETTIITRDRTFHAEYKNFIAYFILKMFGVYD